MYEWLFENFFKLIKWIRTIVHCGMLHADGDNTQLLLVYHLECWVPAGRAGCPFFSTAPLVANLQSPISMLWSNSRSLGSVELGVHIWSGRVDKWPACCAGIFIELYLFCWTQAIVRAFEIFDKYLEDDFFICRVYSIKVIKYNARS